MLKIAMMVLLVGCGVDPSSPEPAECETLAPEANPCCAFDLGCSEDPVPAECVPPTGTCWERSCPLVDGSTVRAGSCD